MMRNFIPRKALPVAVLGLLAAGNAAAQSIVASTTDGVINQQNHGSTVIFTNTNPATVGAFDFELTYDSTNLTIETADITTDSAGTSCNVPNPGTILCFANPVQGLLLPASIQINLPFDIGAVEGVEALTFGTTNVFDGGGVGVNLVPTSGQITISAAPPDVVLGFNPAAAVNFPGGTSGDTTAASIAVTVASGTIGTGTVDNCVISGANAGAFSVAGGVPAVVPPAGSIDLEVTLANSALSATLTCDVDDASVATTHVWQLSAPAGTPVPAPTYSSSPAPGTTLTCNGQPGATTQTSVTVTNTGFAGVGSELDITSCSTTGTGFSVIAGADPAPLAVGASTQITVQCTVPAEGEPAATGTLTCVHNDAANSPAEYPLSAEAATAPPPIPQPNVVPASSLWSQLSLIGLMAALGLLVVGIRRKH